jgi:hypothetical protein
MNIIELSEAIQKLGAERKYHEQGALFMEETGTQWEVVEAVPQTAPTWATDNKHGIKYSITLKRKGQQYTFDFWGSIADREKIDMAKKAQEGGIYSPAYFAFMDWCKNEASPTVPNSIRSKNARGIPTDSMGRVWLNNAVDTVKAIIQPKPYYILTCLHPMSADTFEEFCAEFGYDEDSRTAEQTYNACITQDRAMRKMYSSEELEALNEIS